MASRRWRDNALCAQTDPEVFFPDRGQSNAPAKRICARCEVRAECRDHALSAREPFGVWGGTSEKDRQRMRRRG